MQVPDFAGSLCDSGPGSTRRFSGARRYISRSRDFKFSSFQLLEEESVRFRGHQAEVAMITITACSYLTLVDPKQQDASKHLHKCLKEGWDGTAESAQ